MTCIVCKKLEKKKLLTKTLNGRTHQKITLCQCLNCQTVYLDQWPSEFIPALYEYYSERNDLDKKNLYNSINESRCESILNSLNTLVKGNKMLDIGCGQGQFVDVALRCGWDASGIELSDSAVAICHKFGLPVKKIEVFDSTLQPNSFDLIVLSEVIEHISHPDRFIARTAELLAPGGLLYLTTPNFNSLDRLILGTNWRVIHAEHLSYFTPKTLKNLIKNYTSLKLLYLHTRNLSGESIQRLSPRWVINLSRDNDGLKSIENRQNSSENTQVLREKIEDSRSLKTVKIAVNVLLNLLKSGSAMFALYRKPY